MIKDKKKKELQYDYNNHKLQPYSPDTARALDAAGHDGFDERPDVLVLNCSFPFCETTAVCTKLHGLILVGQQEECQTHIKTLSG